MHLEELFGLDTVEGFKVLMGEDCKLDLRNFDGCAAVLKFFGVESCFVMTNNPMKLGPLERNNIKYRRIKHAFKPKNRRVAKYLEAKKKHMGHLI